jgi:hypothetical protein
MSIIKIPRFFFFFLDSFSNFFHIFFIVPNLSFPRNLGGVSSGSGHPFLRPPLAIPPFQEQNKLIV